MTEERKSLILVYPRQADEEDNKRLDDVLESALGEYNVRSAATPEEVQALLAFCAKDPSEKRILFAISLGNHGINMPYYDILKYIRNNSACLQGFTGGLVVDGLNDLYTKSIASELALAANQAGCEFVGRALVEGTRTLSNYAIMAKNWETDLMGAYKKAVRDLVGQLFEQKPVKKEKPNLLVLHASMRETSNTLALWSMVKSHLEGIEIREMGLRNGAVSDCAGCNYETCLHFGEKGSCFYGGVMVDDVFPAVKKADAIVMLCPNYNDSISANMMAFINRLTALFRINRFYEKSVFGIIVSGYSGSEILARQLISALNMNKAFRLPGNFSMMVTANEVGSAVKIPGIETMAEEFADNIMNVLKD